MVSVLADFFCNQGNIEVHLLLFGKSPELFYEIQENIKIHIPSAPFIEKKRFFSAVKRLFYLRRTTKSIEPDAILSFGEYWNSFVLIALWGLRYDIFISDRCSPEKQYGFFHSLIRAMFYPKATGIISQTDYAKRIYKDKFRHKNITVIGNPFIIKEVNENQREKIVLTIGRLIKSKNHRQLIDMFSEINMPEWKFIIVGGDSLKGDLHQSLKEYIKEKREDHRIFLEGYKSNVDMFYKKAGIFVFASETEGFPNVIGEAMAAGLPVIAFNCIAGPSEMISDGHDGFLVQTKDYSEFKQKLQLLMERKELRDKLGRNAAESIQKYSVENVGERFLNFIFAR